jgi:ribosome-binding protein aMBF1 (putative translation factor)
MVLTMIMGGERKEVGVENSQMLMCSCCSVRVSIRRMEMQRWQQQEDRQEQREHPYAQDGKTQLQHHLLSYSCFPLRRKNLIVA